MPASEAKKRPSWDLNALSNAARYNDLAVECLRLGGLATDRGVREHYRKIAWDSLALAHAELRLSISGRCTSSSINSADIGSGISRSSLNST
jgi:hypothetical protein